MDIIAMAVQDFSNVPIKDLCILRDYLLLSQRATVSDLAIAVHINKGQQPTGLLDLPHNALMDIMFEMELKDIANLCKTTLTIGNICNDTTFWNLYIPKYIVKHIDSVKFEYEDTQFKVIGKCKDIRQFGSIHFDKRHAKNMPNDYCEFTLPIKVLSDYKEQMHDVIYKELVNYSIKYGLLGLLKSLLDSKIPIDLDYAIKEASSKGHINMVKYLIDLPKVKSVGKALPKAIKRRDTDFIRYLLKHPKASNFDDAILTAAKYGTPDIIKLLLSDPRIDSRVIDNARDLLENAAAHGTPDIIKLLLSDPRIDSFVIDNAHDLLVTAADKRAENVEAFLSDPRFTKKVLKETINKIHYEEGYGKELKLLRKYISKEV